jgi:hypothetical protein
VAELRCIRGEVALVDEDKFTPIPGCEKHRPFPTSYCSECCRMWDEANHPTEKE